MVTSSMDPAPDEGLKLVAIMRRDLYGLFAALLVEPASEESLRLLRDDETAAFLQPLGEDRLTERLRASASVSYDELRQEFYDLFVVPGQRFVTPAESVYRDVRLINGEPVGRLLMGTSCVSVHRDYALAGFEPDSARPMPADHIAIELCFVSRLCERERAALEAGRGDEAATARTAAEEFLREHVSAWLPALRKAVDEKATMAFYPVLLAAVERLVELDVGSPDAGLPN